eukprot:COSAG06_NODE_1223_length_10199_cov_3.394356_2_plen_99_part_00
MCLRTPGVREAAIRQKKDADDAAARLEQVGEVSLGEQYGVATRHGAVRLSLSLRQMIDTSTLLLASQPDRQTVSKSLLTYTVECWRSRPLRHTCRPLC